ncbi:hypothetical protein IM753_03185 [Moraxella sp. K127]|uniref:DNA-directed RNA polymerase subunit alpha C-terminal domain-containing protein n=1 Tax=Moraxella sp. K127 TaxID=2780079 RepID=UPI0019F15342|nr:DNA-directed RNA polymerase subunit alpha C-terminal domain-containing protein [Moraxella sp. K127]MBE9589995.1 hypothetical protein [Moraxella sp. K127]
MYWLTLQKHFEHTANLLDDLHKKQEAEYIREVVIPRLHQDADILQKRGKKTLYELVQTGKTPQKEHWVQDLLDRDRQTNPNYISNKKIADCELTVRTKNALIQSNIHTIGDLVLKSEFDLLRLNKNIGKKTLKEIQDFLTASNLSLREQ